MTLEKRLAKLEAALGQDSDPQADVIFARLVARLDRLAAEISQGGEAEAKAREELSDLMTDLCL